MTRHKNPVFVNQYNAIVAYIPDFSPGDPYRDIADLDTVSTIPQAMNVASHVLPKPWMTKDMGLRVLALLLHHVDALPEMTNLRYYAENPNDFVPYGESPGDPV